MSEMRQEHWCPALKLNLLSLHLYSLPLHKWHTTSFCGLNINPWKAGLILLRDIFICPIWSPFLLNTGLALQTVFICYL